MLHAVIMAGGSGTRFWPKSRRNLPKQLLRLHGDATMIQQTALRIAPVIPSERTLVITGADQADATRAQLPEIPPERIVGEPSPRDTAACVGLAAALVAGADPDGIMVVMPADHVIHPESEFQRSIKAAEATLKEDPSAFVTFGIRPDRPETGYGYIEREALIGEPEGVPLFQVKQFREKPDRPTAEAFLESGRFFWNAGIFIWHASVVLESLRKHRPAIGAAIDRIAESLGTNNFEDVLRQEYPQIERVPIDKAVMEHASNVKVLEVPYHWSDVGDWRALTSLHPPDSNGNSLQGPVYAVDSTNCIVVADDDRLIATLGLEDLVIVQSSDATLIAKKDQLDKLKKMVEGLGDAGYPELL